MCIEHEESTDFSTKVGIDRHVKKTTEISSNTNRDLDAFS